MIEGQECGKCIHFRLDPPKANSLGQPTTGQCRGTYPQIVVIPIEDEGQAKAGGRIITQKAKQTSILRTMFPPMLAVDPGCGLPVSSVPGVVASLSKKGLVVCSDGVGNRIDFGSSRSLKGRKEDDTISVTDKGHAFYLSLKASKGATMPATETAKKTVAKKTVTAAKHPTKKGGKGSKGGKKAVVASNGKADKPKRATKKPTDPILRKQATFLEITVGQLRVLQAISKSPSGLTYKQIFKKTGIYNPLTAYCRPTHDGSLGTWGYISEEQHDVDNRDVLFFKITIGGKKALQKIKNIT